MSTESHDRTLFIDAARIVVRGGRGGNGCMSFRREKYVDRGGPDGGNGGRGGSVLLKADPQKKSLLDLTYRPHFYAEEGKPGQGSNKVGRSAEDLMVPVPLGTMVYRDGKLQADLKSAGDTFLAARGGRGGRGNAAFKTQRNTAPTISEKGEPGEEFDLSLELKILADVGLVGFPNAGKSTFLASVTGARPKIAAYPFTTLNPNLGVADWRNTRLVLADIPGLIEGAHAGRGLGHDFLRHIERTRMLFHLVDLFGYEGRDAAACIRLINEELALYSPVLMKKPMVIVANKMDLTDADKRLAALKRKIKKHKIFPISAATGQGVSALLAYAAREMAKPEAEPEKPPTVEPTRFVVELDFEVQKRHDYFQVSGARVERLAAMTNFDQREALKRFQNILRKMGVEKELARQGAQAGDAVKIGKIEFSYEP
ncbi:MAG TPA: GTPase ObgE [Elusimicrobiota bacterium]|nr:GTPase ObgE [Elusimicrobiota bacterium]